MTLNDVFKNINPNENTKIILQSKVTNDNLARVLFSELNLSGKMGELVVDHYVELDDNEYEIWL